MPTPFRLLTPAFLVFAAACANDAATGAGTPQPQQPRDTALASFEVAVDVGTGEVTFDVRPIEQPGALVSNVTAVTLGTRTPLVCVGTTCTLAYSLQNRSGMDFNSFLTRFGSITGPATLVNGDYGPGVPFAPPYDVLNPSPIGAFLHASPLANGATSVPRTVVFEATGPFRFAGKVYAHTGSTGGCNPGDEWLCTGTIVTCPGACADLGFGTQGYCFDTPNGATCTSDFPCNGTPLCSSNADCGAGEVCVVNSCCGTSHCVPACN